MEKKRVFAGMRPTSRLHVGNYLGAAKGMIALQDKPDLDCIFGVMVYHAITTPYNPKQLPEDTRAVVLDYLGAGLDPGKCHLIIQSEEHIILSYLLGTIYQVSRLEDLPTYKEKKEQNPEYVNMGLLYYPILMAADILIYKAELVPIGKDQEPHLEVAREIARKFNSMFPSTSSGQVGDTFPEPHSFTTPAQDVPSLLGEGKMSKSKGGAIALTDSLQEIKKTLAKAVTFVELFEGHDRAQQYREMYKTTGIKYGELKAELAEAIFKELKPIQERRKYYQEHPELVDKILEDGRIYAKKIADETLKEVRQKMGLDD